MAVYSGVITQFAQALLFLALICCTYSAKLPAAEQHKDVIAEGRVPQTGTNSLGGSAGIRSVPIASSDDLEVVAHTGSDGLGRQKRYIGWGRRPSLRYSKATSTFDHDSLFNRMHNNFDKRGLGPEAPISNFRELRMKQKVPNFQLLLPHLPMRNTRVPAPDADVEDAAGLMINDLDRTTGGKLSPEDLDALAYLLEGDIQ